MKTLLLIVLSLVFAPAVFATAQNAERLDYHGEDLKLFSTPLEEAFSEKRPRPNDVLQSWSTANWRGYIGHWSIKDDRLLLTALYRERGERDAEGNYKFTQELIPLDKVLGQGAAYPAKADWFTGTLRIQKGKLVRYVHMGFGSQHEQEIVLQIEAGRLIKAVEIAYDPEKDAYRSTPDMQWVALGDDKDKTPPAADWIDGRLLVTSFMYPFLKDKRSFKTRGILFNDDQGPCLWIPGTQKTEALTLPLHKAPSHEIPKGSHVEIEARFYAAGENHELEATSLRALKPGETIHHPLFPAQSETIREQPKKPPLK
jgi:hypothetical protein